jgi:hypothetical protein
MIKKGILILLIFQFSSVLYSIESLDGFLVSAYDDRFRVISPEKYKDNMEVIVENKTLVKLIGKLAINKKNVVSYFAVAPEKFQRVVIKLKKGDVLNFIPLSPAFQDVELIVGNKIYEIPPRK